MRCSAPVTSPSHLLPLTAHHRLLTLLRSPSAATASAAIHAASLKSGVHHVPPFPAALLSAYRRSGHLSAARRLFDETPHKDLFIWSSILAAESQSDDPRRAFSLFRRMSGLLPDNHIFATLINACARVRSLNAGRQAHARFLTSPFARVDDDDVVKSSLVDMYSKCARVDDARRVFDSIARRSPVAWTAMVSGLASNGRALEAVSLFDAMPTKGLFAWTALIAGLVRNGDYALAVQLFEQMRVDGVLIDEPFVISNIVCASLSLLALELGWQLHCLTIKLGFEASVIVSNSLAEMYAKCSDIVSSKRMFDRMSYKDVISWTTMIVALAQHGMAFDALAVFDQMVSTGIRPNEATFIGVLDACSHGGLVDRGQRLFDSMVNEYRIEPSLQHYTCLLDLFSRSGLLMEAERLIMTMPFEPDEAAWAALLSACERHGNTKLVVWIADQLLRSSPKDPSTWILLSNAYAMAGEWGKVSKVRNLMASMKTKKEFGFSRIELGNEIVAFAAGEM
ncbi:Pentatricopeptide repeat-containing protein [Acorus gramineus]|uniref:Pentatricopeptide repeat-containing protein n=1 Tax=Acorus gramineus TaxID=55184 RepID=A0AAV9AWL0_ACOGR|nr:Pentatricopeptide repeat-containing protein [Acorus gramineus]